MNCYFYLLDLLICQDLEDSEFIEEFGNGADWFFWCLQEIDQLYLMKQQLVFHFLQMKWFFDLIENKKL